MLTDATLHDELRRLNILDPCTDGEIDITRLNKASPMFQKVQNDYDYEPWFAISTISVLCVLKSNGR